MARRRLRRLELPRRAEGVAQARRLHPRTCGRTATRPASAFIKPKRVGQDALQRRLGVYYRVNRASVVDMQAAILEIGAIYVSADVHDGWGIAARNKSITDMRRCRRSSPSASRIRSAATRSRWSASTASASSSRTPGACRGATAASA